jgi:Flp pilus assembly pilin Flp
MSDLTLHTVSRIQVNLYAARHAVAAHFGAGAHRVAERFRREQTGQDVLEYTGLIVFVAAIIALMFAIQLPQKVAEAVVSAANSVFSQGQTQYSAPTLTAPTG